MKFLSLFSGIEAASVAWHPLGWRPVGFSEIEKFPCKVLAHHYPHVTNYGDVTKFKDWNIGQSIDLIVGGSPCQSFSVAGLRKGLDDPRGNLMLTYLAVVAEHRPRWVLWENVPGVLSNNKGEDFATFLTGLAQLGYGFAYRVLDAQYVRTDGYPYAVPQKRRRVFVVGYFGGWRSAAAVLFDRESLSWNPPPSKRARQETAAEIRGMLANGQQTTGTLQSMNPSEKSPTLDRLKTLAVAFKVRGGCEGGGKGYLGSDETAFTLSTNQDQQITVYENHPQDSRITELGEVCSTVTKRWGTGGGNVPLAQMQMRVRRLTPTECARLQGFPEYEKYIEADVCYLGHQKSCVSVETKSHKSQKNVFNVAENANPSNVNLAELNLQSESGLKENHAVLNVRLSSGIIEVQLSNHKKFQSNVSGAENQKWFRLPILTEDFARLLALTARCLAKIQLLGKAEQQRNASYSIHQVSGKLPFCLSGKEMQEYAKDVGKSINQVKRLSTSITLETTPNTQVLERNLQTLFCCALGVIVGCIPKEIKPHHLSKVTLLTNEGYLSQVKGASDSAMYKALGNSMAVNCMHLLGQRIQMVEQLSNAKVAA